MCYSMKNHTKGVQGNNSNSYEKQLIYHMLVQKNKIQQDEDEEEGEFIFQARR